MNFSLCKYNNLLGNVNEGIHSYKILGISYLDTIVVILCSYAISKFFDIDLIQTLIIVFLLGIIIHNIFCVKTKVDQLLFN